MNRKRNRRVGGVVRDRAEVDPGVEARANSQDRRPPRIVVVPSAAEAALCIVPYGPYPLSLSFHCEKIGIHV